MNLISEQLKYVFEPEKAAKFQNISDKIADFGKNILISAQAAVQAVQASLILHRIL